MKCAAQGVVQICLAPSDVVTLYQATSVLVVNNSKCLIFFCSRIFLIKSFSVTFSKTVLLVSMVLSKDKYNSKTRRRAQFQKS